MLSIVARCPRPGGSCSCFPPSPLLAAPCPLHLHLPGRGAQWPGDRRHETMGATDPIPIGRTAIKPVERHGLEAIKWFLYDKETVITSAALKSVFSQPQICRYFPHC